MKKQTQLKLLKKSILDNYKQMIHCVSVRGTWTKGALSIGLTKKEIVQFPLLVLLVLFLSVHCHSFEGVGECSKLITDFAFLTKKSVYLPEILKGSCVIHSEKDFTKVMRSAGFNYKEQGSVITLTEIPASLPKIWHAPLKRYVVNFAFLNKSSVIDCGLKMQDVLASLNNLSVSFSVGASFGCPAFDDDGSFAFSANATLTDRWNYTHGTETQRPKSTITSSTGAVTTEFDYLTTGLDISLNQTEHGQYYALRYTSNNGSIITSAGAITELVESDIVETYKKKRKLWFIPLGEYVVESNYKMLLQIKELK